MTKISFFFITVIFQGSGKTTGSNVNIEFQAPKGAKAPGAGSKAGAPVKSEAVVPKGQQSMVPMGNKSIAMKKEGGMLIPEGNFVRVVNLKKKKV